MVIVILAGALYVSVRQVLRTTKQYETAMANVKAYDSQLGYEKKKSAAFQLTVDQLKYFNDSVLKELDQTRKDLKIKDKNLKALQAVQSSFSKKDTVTFYRTDTLFKEPSLAIDTLIGDEWYSVSLGLRYPSTVIVSPTFISKKHIIVSTRKETVNPPKKFWLLRLFQKKHSVLRVDVVEKNPYVDGETDKYVEIIK